MKNRLPIVISVTALVIAVLGVTPLGGAAVNGTVPEKTITDLLKNFKNFKYVSQGIVGQYPYTIEGLTSSTNPIAVVEDSSNVRYNDCTTFTEALLVKAWIKERSGFAWSWAKHQARAARMLSSSVSSRRSHAGWSGPRNPSLAAFATTR